MSSITYFSKKLNLIVIIICLEWEIAGAKDKLRSKLLVAGIVRNRFTTKNGKYCCIESFSKGINRPGQKTRERERLGPGIFMRGKWEQNH